MKNAPPDLKLVIRARVAESDTVNEVTGEMKGIWKTIGDMSLWESENGDWSGQARLYQQPGVIYRVYEQTKKEKHR